MRILLASEFYYPSVGGVQEVMRQIGERSAEIGHEVVVATTHLPERKSHERRGVTIKDFRISGNLVRGMAGEVERYREYVLRQEYDVLMIKAAQQWTFDALTPVFDSIKKPKIFIPCGFSGLFEPQYAAYFQEMPSWLRKFDRLIFYASDYRDINLARKHGIVNFTIISNGADEREFNVECDSDFRARQGIEEDAFVILTVGSLTGGKGHLELARAFEQCDLGNRMGYLILNGNVPPYHGGPDRRVARRGGRVLGEIAAMYKSGGSIRVAKWMLRLTLQSLRIGPLLKKLYPRKAALPESLHDVVHRINAMPDRKAIVCDLARSDLVQAYLNSDLFVLASKIEYSPLVLYEAAAAGLPFLSAAAGNAVEIASWTGGGIVYPTTSDERGHMQTDPAVLAQEISMLAMNRERLRALGETGRRNWSKKFTWREIAGQYEALFTSLISLRRDESANGTLGSRQV